VIKKLLDLAQRIEPVDSFYRFSLVLIGKLDGGCGYNSLKGLVLFAAVLFDSFKAAIILLRIPMGYSFIHYIRKGN
jgi:hypothetical protein